MVKMLAITPEEMTNGALTFIDFTDGHLETAKRNLSERVALFGLQERFDTFCEDLADRLGMRIDERVHAQQTELEEVSDEFRARIARDNNLDVQLYEYARARWAEAHPEQL
jgi:hypothetical protein